MDDLENKILNLANKAGKIALENGAETYRAENIICRICRRFALEPQCFVAITGIITSVRNSKGDSFCLVERVTSRTTNLNKVHIINNIIRHLDDYSFEELEKEIDDVKNKDKRYKKIINFLAYCGGAFSFTLLFNGGIYDAIASFIGGGVIFIISDWATKIQSNSFFLNTLGGFLCTNVSYLGVKLGITQSVSYSTIGTIMLLVPGIALTNAIRDMVAGDLISGVSRAIEAFLVGVALACGTGFALYLIYW
ncbi:threonine/serine exporter ThrE family protein [Fusobacterium sp.]|uniref:threonine/serine ThrE exporter family protein n=1 Tax=Fusobacterium sp. TaxID=68766 RepID=UPI00396C5891